MGIRSKTGRSSIHPVPSKICHYLGHLKDMHQLIILQVAYWMLGYLSVERIPPFVSLSHIEQKELRRIMYAASFSCWETGSHQRTSHPHMSLGEKKANLFCLHKRLPLEACFQDTRSSIFAEIWKRHRVTGSMRWSASQQTFHRILE